MTQCDIILFAILAENPSVAYVLEERHHRQNQDPAPHLYTNKMQYLDSKRDQPNH